MASLCPSALLQHHSLHLDSQAKNFLSQDLYTRAWDVYLYTCAWDMGSVYMCLGCRVCIHVPGMQGLYTCAWNVDLYTCAWDVGAVYMCLGCRVCIHVPGMGVYIHVLGMWGPVENHFSI